MLSETKLIFYFIFLAVFMGSVIHGIGLHDILLREKNDHRFGKMVSCSYLISPFVFRNVSRQMRINETDRCTVKVEPEKIKSNFEWKILYIHNYYLPKNTINTVYIITIESFRNKLQDMLFSNKIE